jgi:hypothetical protein
LRWRVIEARDLEEVGLESGCVGAEKGQDDWVEAFTLDPSLSSRSRWSSDVHRDSGVLAAMLGGDGRQLFVARCPRFRKGMLLRRLKQLLAVNGVNSRQQHGRVAAFSEREVVGIRRDFRWRALCFH